MFLGGFSRSCSQFHPAEWGSVPPPLSGLRAVRFRTVWVGSYDTLYLKVGSSLIRLRSVGLRGCQIIPEPFLLCSRWDHLGVQSLWMCEYDAPVCRQIKAAHTPQATRRAIGIHQIETASSIPPQFTSDAFRLIWGFPAQHATNGDAPCDQTGFNHNQHELLNPTDQVSERPSSNLKFSQFDCNASTWMSKCFFYCWMYPL